MTSPVDGKIQFGIGWDKVTDGGKAMDLDTACLALTDGVCVDHVDFKKLSTADGGISLSEDNRTGKGEG